MQDTEKIVNRKFFMCKKIFLLKNFYFPKNKGGYLFLAVSNDWWGKAKLKAEGSISAWGPFKFAPS